jgi:hypothetical protein
VVLVILAALIGMIVMLLTEGIMRTALYEVGKVASEVAKRTAEETADAIVEDAASTRTPVTSLSPFGARSRKRRSTDSDESQR